MQTQIHNYKGMQKRNLIIENEYIEQMMYLNVVSIFIDQFPGCRPA